MQNPRETKQSSDRTAQMDNVLSDQSSLLDFNDVIQDVKNEFKNDDEFKILNAEVKSKTSYELELKNGTKIHCQQEETSKGLHLKATIKLNKAIDSKKLADLAIRLTTAHCKAAGIKPSPQVQVYLSIEPASPENQKLSAALKKAFRDKGFTVLDNPPELKPHAPSPSRR